jgi:ABC-type ATPase with predicted acetyltransferase domain
MEKAIEVKGLRKSFKDTEVLKGVDFEVKQGEIFALFGSNGVGKTAIVGLSTKSPDGAGAFSYPLIFLPFISSAFVPTESMPLVVRAFAENQPVTSIVALQWN